MFEIRFYCPTEQQDIDTGIRVDEDTFERTRLNLVHVPCTRCGELHRFLMGDAHTRAPNLSDVRLYTGGYEEASAGLYSMPQLMGDDYQYIARTYERLKSSVRPALWRVK